MAIIKKRNNAVSASKPKIIQVNPYEYSDNVLELMARICSAKPSADTNVYRNLINDALNKKVRGYSLLEYLKENRKNLSNFDFRQNLDEYCMRLELCLTTHENTKHTQIVVAGGFSSGKSSFLNRLTNSAKLLPTGVEPVSVVKTYLYCSNDYRLISVKGVNQKNVLVNLDPGVLQAIQHAKKSNIYLASVLDKLFIEIPSQELDGIVFIDTPGYNNSDKANQSNGKTDKETALEALEKGNVLFWLIDCERGTTVSDDIEIIKQFHGKKVFIFNKADKKGAHECKNIVDDAAKILYKEFPENEIIDIIAYSTLDDRIYYSHKKKTLSDIITEAKSSGNGVSELNLYKEIIGMLFDDEISACQNSIKSYSERYKKEVNEKDQWQKKYNESKDRQDYLISNLKGVLLTSYDNVLKAASDLAESSEYAPRAFKEFYDGGNDFENNDHWGSSSILTRAIGKAMSRLDYGTKKHKYATKYENYPYEHRKELVNKVEAEETKIVDGCKDMYKKACQDCENTLLAKQHEEIMEKDMQEYKRVFMAALETGINTYLRMGKAATVHNENNSAPNVFECIRKNDYKLFLHSFEDGVDLSVCNPDGYNPLTFAVQSGNNMMVQFMLDHDADPFLKDNRGYNAFHTAVENQYRDICKILLDADPDLIHSKTASGESVALLAQNQTFSKWIEQEIDNVI